jgi:hypothetical protein
LNDPASIVRELRKVGSTVGAAVFSDDGDVLASGGTPIDGKHVMRIVAAAGTVAGGVVAIRYERGTLFVCDASPGAFAVLGSPDLSESLVRMTFNVARNGRVDLPGSGGDRRALLALDLTDELADLVSRLSDDE